METFSALLALCEGNSPVTFELPSQRPVTRSFDFFFDLCLNKRLSKQRWGCWFETPLRSLWRHCNEWRPQWDILFTRSVMAWYYKWPEDDKCIIFPANTSRDNDVVITSQRRHFDVITSKWRRFDVITSLLLRHVFSGLISIWTHTRLTFLFWMVHCGIWGRCIVGFVRKVYWYISFSEGIGYAAWRTLLGY